MVFRHTDNMASKMWETARERIPEAARLIAGGGKMPIHPRFFAKTVSALCRIKHWFYPKNGRLFRVDNEKCVRCMKCVRDCPTGNITFKDGKFAFGKNCIGCVRCSFNCPKDAIHIGLIDFMRVNGPYDLTRDPDAAVTGRFCKKAYMRYFSDSPNERERG